MSRFVILYHEVPPGGDRVNHYDVMLEENGALRTYEVLSVPRVGEITLARRLANHRLDYLTYTGPVSGNRGHVTRYDHGTYALLAESVHEITIKLCGDVMQGSWTLRLQTNEC